MIGVSFCKQLEALFGEVFQEMIAQSVLILASSADISGTLLTLCEQLFVRLLIPTAVTAVTVK